MVKTTTDNEADTGDTTPMPHICSKVRFCRCEGGVQGVWLAFSVVQDLIGDALGVKKNNLRYCNKDLVRVYMKP